MPYKSSYYTVLLLVMLVFVTGCKKDEDSSLLKNDCIKRSLGPNLVGQNLEFAYAMALPASAGKIVSAKVEASIAGATGTYLENRSFHTSGDGQDVGISVGDPSVNTGNQTEVLFTKDTCAATLRYYYTIPEEARGKTVTFTFSTTGSNGETVSYNMGPYTISNMDMKLNLTVSDNNACYISIADLTAYNAADAALNADKIDLVYLYRTNSSFKHALVSPAADTAYLRGVTLPAGVNRSTKVNKVFGLRDRQLDRGQYGIYIDDIDFQAIGLTSAPNYAINMKNESGIWLETADGTYRAYVYVKTVTDASKSMIINIKRLKMK